MVDFTFFTAIVASVTALGVAGGLILNGLSIRSKTKNEYYQILKELQDEFVTIDGTVDKDTNYETKIVNLHEKVAHLSIKKIISDDIASYFDGTFPRALYFAQNDPDHDIEECKKQVPNLFKYCEDKNIQSIPPP